jgi:integrase
VTYLRDEKLWGNDDPVFPATRISLGASRQFKADGLERKHWNTASPIRRIFREAFTLAQLPHFHPHSIRDTLVNVGYTLCQTPEQGKALSQNLGHDDILTTFRNYGEVSTQRQGEIMRQLAEPRTNGQSSLDALADAVARKLRDNA